MILLVALTYMEDMQPVQGRIVTKDNPLFLLSLLLSISIVGASLTSLPVCLSEIPRASPRLSSLVPHSPISISGNAGFAALGFPGSGSQQSPYIIEGLEIAADDICIRIFDTDAHFVIRNCTLSSQTDGAGVGICLWSADNGVIENCTSYDCSMGFMLVGTGHCIVANNTVTGCRNHGIRVVSTPFSQSQNVTVVNNVINGTGGFGFYVESTANCRVVNNSLENGGFGIEGNLQYWIHDFSGNTVNGKPFGYFLNENNTQIDGVQFGQVFLINCFNVSIRSGEFFNASVGVSLLSCTNCTISDTEFRGNLYGINLLVSQNTTLESNTLIDCGIRFTGDSTRYWTITESGNTVNGKQFGYFLNESSLVIEGDDYGQLVLVESDDSSVANGTFDSVTVGVTAESCFNCSIRDVLLTDNHYAGILISDSANCSLTNVISEGSTRGLYISSSDNVTVTESQLHGNGNGIYVYNSSNFLFDSNQIYDNNGNPIYLVWTYYGMIRSNQIHDNSDSLRLYVVNYLEIVNNTVSGSSSDGLYMDFTSGVRVVDNRIYGNTGYGLKAGSYSLYSEIYNNVIGFNEAGNAMDNGVYNEWDDGVGTGNVWSDYSGVGVYPISGMGVDNHPSGFLSHPADVQYLVGAFVSPITWDVRLPNPDSYAILWNGDLIHQNSLNSSSEHVSVTIGSLTAGTYNLTLVVVDGSGYGMVDTVIITVNEETTTATSATTSTTGTTTSSTSSPLPDGMTVLIIVIVGAVCVIAVLLTVAIRKR